MQNTHISRRPHTEQRRLCEVPARDAANLRWELQIEKRRWNHWFAGTI
jgi:hypothetical protein